MNQDMYWDVKVMKMQLMLRVLSTLDRLHFHSNPCRIFSHQNTLTLEFIASKWQLLHKHNLWIKSRLEAIVGTCNTFLSWKLWYLVLREALPILTFLLHHFYVNFLLDFDFLLNSDTFMPVNVNALRLQGSVKSQRQPYNFVNWCTSIFRCWISL